LTEQRNVRFGSSKHKTTFAWASNSVDVQRALIIFPLLVLLDQGFNEVL
jgi:hypothetical protein